MARQIEFVAGLLVGLLGLAAAAATLLVGPSSLTGSGREVGLEFILLVILGVLLVGGVATSAYLHSRYGYGSGLTWFFLVILAIFTISGAWVGYGFAPAVIVGFIVAIAGLRGKGINYS